MGGEFKVVTREHGVEELELADNGLRLLLVSDASVPVVASCVVYHVGSRHEVTGGTGSTHLLEHLLFKGSRKFNASLGTPVARVLERVGASFNATTWLDRTSYYEVLSPEHLSLALELEADRMRHALLRAEDLESELSVVRNELERGENDPFEVLLKESFAIAFREHPYHHPTIGWRSDVENASIARLRGFYDTFYHPDNATLLLVGAFDRNETLELVGRHFGELPRGSQPRPSVTTVEPRQEGERRFVVRRAGEVGWVVTSWRIPEAASSDTYPLAVAADALSGGVMSRLYQRLVETGKCLDVQAVAWQLRDPGLFQVFASLNPPTGHAEVESTIRETVAELSRAPLQPDELERCKVLVEAQTAFHRDSPAQVAAALTEAVACGDWQAYFSYLDRVRAVGATDVVEAAGRHFRDDAISVGYFVPTGDGSGATQQTGGVPGPAPCHFKARLAENVEQHDLVCGARVLTVRRTANCTVHLQGSLVAGHGVVDMTRWSAASLLPEMLERGTVRRSRVELARAREDRGVSLAFGGESLCPMEVFVSGHCLSRHLPVMLELLAEMLRTPQFPEEELVKLRQLRLGELAQAHEETFQRAYETLSRLTYPSGHPHFRRSFEDRCEALRGIRREDLARLHGELYGPRTLVLALVGDLDPQGVMAALDGLLAGWQGGLASSPEVPRRMAGEVTPAVVKEYLHDRPNLDVLMGCPGGLRRRDDDYVAALLGNAVLGQSTLSSRLGRCLRDREGLTYGVISRFFGASLVDGPWAVTFSVGPDDLDRAVALASETIARYVTEGPEDNELEDEKSAMAGMLKLALATPGGLARELARLARHDLPISELDELPQRVVGTGRSEVVAALRRHIHPDRLCLAVAGQLVASAAPEG